MSDLILPPSAGKYQVVYADPPWQFKTFNMKGKDVKERGQKNAPDRHYECQDINWIKSLPVNEWTDDNAICFLWVSDPLLKEGLDTLEAWGFTFKTVAFTWAKQGRKDHSKWHIGLGFYTRANPEMCLLGRKGKKSLVRENKGVRQLIVEPVREHSRKPDRVRDDITKLYGTEVTKLEMFARSSHDGWDNWGNEVDKFDESKKEDSSDDLIVY